MNPRPIFFAVLPMLLVVAAAGFAAYHVHRAMDASEARVITERQRATLRRAVQLASERKAAIADVANASAADAPAASAPARLERVITMEVLERKERVNPEVAVTRDPTLRALKLQVFDQEFAGIWGPLIKQLNLSEEKTAKLKALLRAHEERRLDVTAVAGDQDLALNDPAIRKMRDADGKALVREARELLGPDDAKIYQQYRRDLELQSLVGDVVAQTYFSATPLTFEESQRLFAILSANAERLPNGFARRSVNWDAALAQVEASNALSSTATAAFRDLAEMHRVESRLGERQRELVTKLRPLLNNSEMQELEIWDPSVPPLEPYRLVPR